jgi:hypothetical protein
MEAPAAMRTDRSLQVIGEVLETTTSLFPKVLVPELMCADHTPDILVRKRNINLEHGEPELVAPVRQCNPALPVGKMLGVVLEGVHIVPAVHKEPWGATLRG